MIQSSIALTYFSSRCIEGYVKEHPIEWPSRELAGTVKNMRIPFSCIGEFFELLKERKGLFTQEEYVDYVFDKWGAVLKRLVIDEHEGLAARLKRNFYPSAVDSLHVFALLVESGEVEKCTLDTLDDVVSKIDLSVTSKDDLRIGIALRAGSFEAQKWAVHKKAHRGGSANNMHVVEVPLPMDRPKCPGNKRWYRTEDFGEVFKALDRKMLQSQEKLGSGLMEFILESF